MNYDGMLRFMLYFCTGTIKVDIKAVKYLRNNFDPWIKNNYFQQPGAFNKCFYE